jgi:hypothetical protein
MNVMPALVAGIHVGAAANRGRLNAVLLLPCFRSLPTWMRGTSPRMTAFSIGNFQR